ncbi:hypothetical protein A134_15745 [Vibrio crassostreae 9CS106]|jgi:hypothetical protein|uniref:hypothetical protein n=3 Tax=Vibrio TaxID=662 RepID=UPI00035DF619|nr:MULTISPECIES: hypothetical protein [unclassified Vibrio]ANP77847.1 hypothetical protein A134_15745 [Vibrio crassostreae 9CS106]NOH92916.1 hypothetical protein [Vibrio sp. AIC-3]
MKMNIYINYFFLLLLVIFSFNSFGYESYSFPVNTKINRANLYDYSINVDLSDEFIALKYDGENETFLNGRFYSYIRTNIPTSSGDSFEYSYNISEFTSKCVFNDSGETMYDDFVDLYIDRKHYSDISDIPNFEFNNIKNTEYENSTNEFELVTNKNIPSDEPLDCNGRITFNVELQL